MPHAAPLTIVIPVYNRAQVLTRTLDSVLAQSFRPLRLIIVDNNSTDNSVRVAREWIEANRSAGFSAELLHEHSPGAAAARNRGLQAVTSEYTMFFDSDDLMLPGHVSRAMEAFTSAEKPDIAGWDVEYRRPDGSRAIKHFADMDLQWNNIMHGSMSTLRYAARTSLFRQAGGWNPLSRGWDDIELGARLLRLSPKIIKLHGAPSVAVFSSAQSITGTDFSHCAGVWENTLAMMRATLSPLGLASYAGCRAAILAGCYRREGACTAARTLLHDTLACEPSSLRRLAYRMAYAWTACRLRGAARLVRPLFP